MSLVYITRHDENIKDIEPKEDFNELLLYKGYFTKLQRQRRRHTAAERKAAANAVIKLPDGKQLLTDAQKNEHKTMGYSETPLRGPCDYLRKNGGVKWQRKREHTCPKVMEPTPPVPRLEELRQQRATTAAAKAGGEKNFIKKNALCIKNAPAKWHPPKYIDFHTGTPRKLENSGLLPQYVCSKRYGKVPVYLNYHKRKLSDKQKMCEQKERELRESCEFRHAGIRQLPAEEREHILKGLKQRFNDVFKSYQAGSLICDTITKRLRKSNLEKELRQLEHDIFLLESNPIIFVSDF